MAVFNLAALAPSALFLSAQHHVGRSWYRALPTVVLLTLVGTGMMINTGRAAIAALGGTAGVFERTPKFGAAGATANWRALRYQGRIDAIVAVELGFAVVCAATVWLAASAGVWAIAVYASIFGTGLLLTAGLSLWQGIGVARFSRSAGAVGDLAGESGAGADGSAQLRPTSRRTA
jgi:hypothetical protein